MYETLYILTKYKYNAKTKYIKKNYFIFPQIKRIYYPEI